MINQERLFKLTRDLIRINSENPPGDESRIAVFVQKYLLGFGVRARIYAFKKKRANVVAALEPGKKGKSLLITPHLDTVPAGRGWRMSPFQGMLRQGKIFGLGATDCKGNLAVSMEVMNSLKEDKAKLDYSLVLAATADEESGSSLGLIPLLDKKILTPDAALVLDADDFEIIITQKGLIHLKVKIAGKRSHGAYPERGVNAIDIAIGIIKEIKAQRFVYARNKYLKAPTINTGTIHGGDKVNVVADWCEFELDFRFLPGTSEKYILGETRRIVKKHARKFSIEIEGIQKPYLIDERHPLVAYLCQAMRKFKVKPSVRGSEGATVITFFQEKKIPAVAFGFGSEKCAHAINEYAKGAHLYKGALILEEFLKRFKLV